jgi:hypothetical protein
MLARRMSAAASPMKALFNPVRQQENAISHPAAPHCIEKSTFCRQKVDFP